MESYTQVVYELLIAYAYLTIFLALMLENTVFLGVVVPGLTVLLLSGFISGNGELNPFLCVLAGFLGTLTGDNLSYLIGRYGAERRWVKGFAEKYKFSENTLEQKSPLVLTFFQFPVYLRVIVPIYFGFVRYPFRKWIAIDFAGSLLFNTTYILIGYIIAKTTSQFADATTIGTVVQYLFAAMFSLWLAWVAIQFYRSKFKVNTV